MRYKQIHFLQMSHLLSTPASLSRISLLAATEYAMSKVAAA